MRLFSSQVLVCRHLCRLVLACKGKQASLHGLLDAFSSLSGKGCSDGSVLSVSARGMQMSVKLSQSHSVAVEIRETNLRLAGPDIPCSKNTARNPCILCPREVATDVPHYCLLMQVAKSALPLLLHRAERMLSNHLASSSIVRSNDGDSSPENFQCLLEVLQVLTVAPSITDAVITPSSPLKVRLLYLCLHRTRFAK